MKKQTKDLELWEVDYLIAKLENQIVEKTTKHDNPAYFFEDRYGFHWYEPTIDPKYSWPIIEREGITTSPSLTENGVIKSWSSCKKWPMNNFKGQCGKTSLEAAMRCYVASVYGDEVEL